MKLTAVVLSLLASFMTANCKQGQFVTFFFYKTKQTNISCRICKYRLQPMIDTNLSDDTFRLCQVQWLHAIFSSSHFPPLPSFLQKTSTFLPPFLVFRRKEDMNYREVKIKNRDNGRGWRRRKERDGKEEGGEIEDVEWRGKMIRCYSETVIRAHNCLSA